MKWLTTAQIVCGAYAVTGACTGGTSHHHKPLPLTSFGNFDTISREDAWAGITKPHHHLTIELNATTLDIGISGTDINVAIPITTTALTESTCTNPNIRFEWRNYSDSDRHAFVDAINCLINKPASGNFPPAANRYEDLVRVHQVNVNTVHGNNVFLPWHRYYVWTFEQIMRDECGFDRAFPWWDEELDAGNFKSSSIFTDAFFGSLPAGTADGLGTCITDGAFANLTCHLGPAGNNDAHCLARALDESSTAEANSDFVNACNSRDSYPDMENCAELGPHAYTHNGIGSVMSDVAASPSDPVFFLHHLFIDRNFWLWQGTNTTRLSEINGCIDTNSPCTPLTLDTVISVNGLRPDVKVRDVINPTEGTLCYKYTY